MVPLRCTNKAACGVRRLPATVLAWQVHCGSSCVLPSTQWLFLCAHGWFSPPLASHPPPLPTPPFHPPTPYILNLILVEFRKKSQNPAVLARWFENFKRVFLEILNTVLCRVFANQVTYVLLIIFYSRKNQSQKASYFTN